MHLRRLWDDDVVSVREGEVVDARGRALRLRTLIARRWGWPKAAAVLAADRLELDEAMTGQPWTLHIADADRAKQQHNLLSRVEGLLPALVTGLAHRSKREAASNAAFSVITVRLASPIVDGGMVQQVIDVVGAHLGLASREEMKQRTTVIPAGELVAIHVETDGLDLDG